MKEGTAASMAGERTLGVLVLPPAAANESWQVLEVDYGVYESIRLPPESSGPPDSVARYNSCRAALDAAYDTLTLIAEGRVPAMHEHTQESVRELVQVLEDRGYDREAAVRLLLDMVDRLSERSPVRRDETVRPSRRAS